MVIRLNEPLFSDMSPAEDAGSLLLSLCFNLQILLDHQSSVSFQNNSPTDQMEGYKRTSGISNSIFTLISITLEQLVNQISKVIKKLSPNQTIEVQKIQFSNEWIQKSTQGIPRFFTLTIHIPFCGGQTRFETNEWKQELFRRYY